MAESTGLLDGLQSVVRLADPNLKGAVIRQEAQIGETILQALNLPIEIPNMYVISALPNGKQVKKHPEDTAGWHPSAYDLKVLDRLFFVSEESNPITNVLMRLMGLNDKRPLKLHFVVSDGGEAYIIDRPFRCGGVCCTQLEMRLFKKYAIVDQEKTGPGLQATDEPILIGRVREDFDDYATACFRCCCLCTHRTHIEKVIPEGSFQFEPQFLLVANTACCWPPGGSNNCCGSTCFRHDAVFNIYDKNQDVVGRVQKTYGGGDGCASFCRCANKFDNYVVEFPPGAVTAEDRMLILTSILQLDYQLFEDKGGGSGGK